jgi:hypothetical protein
MVLWSMVLVSIQYSSHGLMVHGLSLRRFFKKLTIYIVTTQAFVFGILIFHHLSFSNNNLPMRSIVLSEHKITLTLSLPKSQLCDS